MKILTPTQRRDLRAKAHHLDPVVMIGQHGLTPAVLHEIDLALAKHELIKMRVLGDDRDARAALLERVCAEMDCAPVQSLGKVLTVWRLNPEKKKKVDAKTGVKGTKAPKRGKPVAAPRTSARPPVDPVRVARRSSLADPDAAAGGRGRRGAARFAATEPYVPADDAASATRRKSSYTPKTKPKSFSAKPNPRSAWEKKKDAANTSASKGAGTATRRRRTTTT
ncbi:MAG: YhbY family RNA-binding protein [Casimicrobiaceae bacterium]